MTLPASGLITMAQINTELGRASNANSNLNETALRTLAGKSSGVISLSDFYGKSNAPAGFGFIPDSPFTEDYGFESVTLEIFQTGAARFYNTSNMPIDYQWVDGTPNPADYDVQVEIDSIESFLPGNFEGVLTDNGYPTMTDYYITEVHAPTPWLSFSSSASAMISLVINNTREYGYDSLYCTGWIRIRHKPSGAIIQQSFNWYIEANGGG